MTRGVQCALTITAPLFMGIALMQVRAAQPSEIALAVACGLAPEEVTLTIRNTGETDNAVLLGLMLASGRRYLPQELIVEVKTPGGAAVEPLVYRSADPPGSLPGVFLSRMDHWVVSLPAKASFTLTLRSSDFVSRSGRPVASAPGELAVRLTGRPITFDLNPGATGMRDWRVWTGTTVSNTLAFGGVRKQ